MEKINITVIDAIMGSGKSTAMINYIKHQKKINQDKKFLIIVPYLKEVKRYANQLRCFKSIISDKLTKRVALEKNLKDKNDIICTHVLFLQNPDLIKKYASDYILIIDEAINSLIGISQFPKLIDTENLKNDIIVSKEDDKIKLSLSSKAQIYTFSNDDIDYLIDREYIVVDKENNNRILFNKAINPTSIYNCLAKYFSFYDVYKLETDDDVDIPHSYYLTLFPLSAFTNFQEIYIMTYLWSAQKMKYYFDFYGAEYTYLYPISVDFLNYNNHHKDYILSKDINLYKKIEKVIKLNILKKVNMPGYKLDTITHTIVKDKKSRIQLYSFFETNEKSATLTYSFYTINFDTDIGKETVKAIKKNVTNYIKDNLPSNIAKNKKILWTVYENARDDICNKCKYINQENYIAYNTNATNEYQDCNVLIYLINREVNPFEQNFIKKYCLSGKDFNKNIYALSDLIQWIWRSSIRNNKEISIYIPSKRMRNIFLGWLNNYPLSNFIDNNFKKCYLNCSDEENTDIQISISTNTSEIDNPYNNEIYLNDFNGEDEISDEEKKFKNKIIDKMSDFCFNDISEIKKYSYLIEKNIYELSKTYSYRVIYFTIIKLDKELKDASRGKINNQYISNKVKYLFAIINNHIASVNKETIDNDKKTEGYYKSISIINYEDLNHIRKTVPTDRKDFSEFLD